MEWDYQLQRSNWSQIFTAQIVSYIICNYWCRFRFPKTKCISNLPLCLNLFRMSIQSLPASSLDTIQFLLMISRLLLPSSFLWMLFRWYITFHTISGAVPVSVSILLYFHVALTFGDQHVVPLCHLATYNSLRYFHSSHRSLTQLTFSFGFMNQVFLLYFFIQFFCPFIGFWLL